MFICFFLSVVHYSCIIYERRHVIFSGAMADNEQKAEQLVAEAGKKLNSKPFLGGCILYSFNAPTVYVVK
jgi:hypothetical protein